MNQKLDAFLKRHPRLEDFIYSAKGQFDAKLPPLHVRRRWDREDCARGFASPENMDRMLKREIAASRRPAWTFGPVSQFIRDLRR